MEVKNLYLHFEPENLSEAIKIISDIVDKIFRTKIIIYYHKMEKDFCVSFDDHIDVNTFVEIFSQLKSKGFVMNEFDNEIDALMRLEKNSVIHIKFTKDI